MTLSIARAFDQFHRQVVPAGSRRKTAEKIQQHVRRQLGAHLKGLQGSFLTGSIDRGTAVKPINDVDIFVVLDPREHGLSQEPRAAIRALQRALKSALGSTAHLRPQTHSVGVTVGGTDVRLDMVPAIPDAQADVYRIPDRDRGAWIITNPRLHKKRLDAADAAAGSKLRPLIRMTKVARARSFGQLGSYHLEAMSCVALERPPKSFEAGTIELLDGLSRLIMQRIRDLAGGPAIHLELQARKDLARRLEAAHQTALRAATHASAGRLTKAHAQWRHLFGDGWPG